LACAAFIMLLLLLSTCRTGSIPEFNMRFFSTCVSQFSNIQNGMLKAKNEQTALNLRTQTLRQRRSRAGRGLVR
jgi:hypothetical protein